MSPKLPVVSGSATRFLAQANTVPLHNELSKGTLKGILEDAKLTVERLIVLL